MSLNRWASKVASRVRPMLRRGRLPLLQGVVSTDAGRLGEAILARAGRDPAGGNTVRAAIAEVRVGAIADADGRIRQRSRT